MAEPTGAASPSPTTPPHGSLGTHQQHTFPPHRGLGPPREPAGGFFSPTSMGSWRPSRVCSEPFPAGLPQWKWSCSARYRPGRPPPLMAMCSVADSLARLSVTARAAGWGKDGGQPHLCPHSPADHGVHPPRGSSSPGFIPVVTQTHGSGAAPGPCSPRAESTQERWRSRAPSRTAPGEPGQGRVPGRSTHPCAHRSPASTCPGEPGRSLQRRCPRGHRPAAAGACRC